MSDVRMLLNDLVKVQGVKNVILLDKAGRVIEGKTRRHTIDLDLLSVLKETENTQKKVFTITTASGNVIRIGTSAPPSETIAQAIVRKLEQIVPGTPFRVSGVHH